MSWQRFGLLTRLWKVQWLMCFKLIRRSLSYAKADNRMLGVMVINTNMCKLVCRMMVAVNLYPISITTLAVGFIFSSWLIIITIILPKIMKTPMIYQPKHSHSNQSVSYTRRNVSHQTLSLSMKGTLILSNHFNNFFRNLYIASIKLIENHYCRL